MSRPVLLKRQGWCLDFCLALKRELQAASGNHNLSWPHQLALLQDTQPWIFQSEIWWFTTRFHQIPSDSQAQITSKMMVNIGRPPENDGAEGPRIYFQHLCIWIVLVPDSWTHWVQQFSSSHSHSLFWEPFFGGRILVSDRICCALQYGIQYGIQHPQDFWRRHWHFFHVRRAPDHRIRCGCPVLLAQGAQQFSPFWLWRVPNWFVANDPGNSFYLHAIPHIVY